MAETPMNDAPMEEVPPEQLPATVTQTQVEHQFDDLDVDDAPQVGIVMGSKSDMPLMEKAAQELEERGIRHEMRVMSAHRDPDTVADYAKNARMRGLRVIIAGAGLAAAGYPDSPMLGDEIRGLRPTDSLDVEVLHAGTRQDDRRVRTAGGRVLNVTGLGATPGEARDRAYEAAARIQFDGMQMRTDIAARAVATVQA